MGGWRAELNEFLRLRQFYETDFRTILQRTNLKLIDEPGGKILLFDLGRIPRDYPLEQVVNKVGTHFTSVLQSTHPENTYRLEEPSLSIPGMTSISYRVVHIHPVRANLDSEVFHLHGSRRPIPGDTGDQGSIVI